MWIDRFIRASLLSLLLFTPLAFGTVHAWAYSLMEGIIALMVLAWAVKIWLGRNANSDTPNVRRRMDALPLTWRLKLWLREKLSGDAGDPRVWPYALPLTLFIGFIFLQLVPLPPAVLQVISPATYEVYEKALPGWPEEVPFADLLAIAEEENERQGDKETRGQGDGETGGEASIETPYANSDPKAESRRPNPFLTHSPIHPFSPSPSRPLSISPILTQIDLLKFVTYALLFLLVLLYPAPGASRDPNHRAEYEIEFIRPFLYAILISSFLVGMLGFLNLFTWNGRVLWFFTPHDAGGGGAGLRAAAPFIAPPSFANYLALTLPLMVVATFSRSFLTPDRLGTGFRVLCGFAVFIMACGILLSLSRAGWAAAVIGVGVLFLLLMVTRGAQSWIARTPVRRLWILGVAGVGLFLTVAVVFVGPRGQESLDLRLQETATEAVSLHGRFAVWRDSLDMVQNFPIAGVGLGAWPELFSRYKDPLINGAYREAHNDYLELLAETGVVGAFLLIGFFVLCLTQVLKQAFSLDAKCFPVVAALLAGISAMAFHEFFDFNLQIPANALLFTVFLALSLRMSALSLTPSPSPNPESRTPNSARFPAIAGSLTLAACSMLLFTTAFSQPMATYPYYLRKQGTLSDALANVNRYPANPDAHMTLFDTVKGRTATPWQISALERILWLAPGKTTVRDSYASRLLVQGRREEAWYEVTRSVAQAPSVNKHFYLDQNVASTLFPNEQQAIIFGFRKAIEDGHPGALEGMAEFYRRTGRFSDRSNLYQEAAASAGDPNEKADFLLKAANAAISGKELVRAEEMLLDATRLQPADTALFTKLISQVYSPRKELVAAQRVVEEGIQNGADALTLRVSLAEAARSNGEQDIAVQALQRALANGSRGAKSKSPRDRYRSYVRLARVAGSIGQLEVQEQALNKAIKLQPNSYQALMEVGAMHESRRDYNKAAFYYRKATRANRTSANAYARLASIEERSFRFAEADKAYARAVRLAPKDKALKKRYEEFKKRVAKGKDPTPSPSAHRYP